MKRKKYHSVDAFMKDIDLMFDNAKTYNRDDSQIYKDAVELQVRTAFTRWNLNHTHILRCSTKLEYWPSKKKQTQTASI